MQRSAWRGKLGDPKSIDSIRVVELSPQASEHLKVFLGSWRPNERRLLFAACNGTPWDQNLLLKRKFKPLLKALGIRVSHGNGFHAFRHANAALMSSFRGIAEIAAWSRGRLAGFESRRVSTTLRQVLRKFSEFFVFGADSRFFPENSAPGSCRGDDRQLA